MSRMLVRADSVLRGKLELDSATGERLTRRQLIACMVVFGLLYGGIMGSFGGIAGDRIWQVVYSALKVPLLLLATFCLSLPNFFVLNTLLGVRGDFGAAVRALLATQAGLTIILAALGPFTALWYCSCADYSFAVLFNGAMFAVASLSAQLLLRRYYSPLIRRDARHRLLLRIWLVLYSFVAIQMAWLLRPFVGDPAISPEFFRRDSLGNAYVVVARLLWNALKTIPGV